jgi:hypothetical protein
MKMIFDEGGACRFIHSDELADIAPGPLTIRRASHVEPTKDGLWTADLSPVGGPVIGPVSKRAVALAAEVEWLKLNDIPIPKVSHG